jgi:hypothetical protein
MNVVPHISAQPELHPLALLPTDQPVPASMRSDLHKPHKVETIETIEVRASSMSSVLEKIMAYDGGYTHGGLND